MAFIPLLIGPVANLVDTVLKRVLPAEKMSEADRAKLQQEVTLELMKEDWGAVESQLKINLEEAKSDSVFVAGWRPAVGWVCATSLAYSFIVQQFLSFVIGIYKWQLPPLPVLDNSDLMTLLLGMLGLGGLRTFEKVKGVTK